MIKAFFKHLHTVNKHRFYVFVYCSRCGQVWRGLVHDLSKYSPTEFFESVKYYQGSRSPIIAARKDKGYSKAWLHHKGRNKHHFEYWRDEAVDGYLDMPYKYLVETVCDMLSATKVYNEKKTEKQTVLEYWNNHRKDVKIGEKTKIFLDTVFNDIKFHNEDYVLHKTYMKQTYKNVFEKNIVKYPQEIKQIELKETI